MQSDTFDTKNVISIHALIRGIIPIVCKAQIVDPIIERITVYVINTTRRPITVHIKPHKSVDQISMTANAYSAVAFILNPTNLVPKSYVGRTNMR